MMKRMMRKEPSQSVVLSLRLPLLCLLVALLPSPSSCRKDRSAPHAHNGVLAPYQPGPFDLTLNSADEERLANGKSVMKQSIPKSKTATAGGAICVQDVNAPRPAVWNQILRMDDYKGKVSKVVECKNYVVDRHSDGSITMKTKQRISVLPGQAYENYYDHRFYPEKDSLTWTLDYDKTSDFDDVSGHWHVTDHPHKEGCARVFYACDVKMRNAPPGPIMSYLSKSALVTATGWVKRESEKEPTNTFPSGFAPKGRGAAAKKIPSSKDLVGAAEGGGGRGMWGRTWGLGRATQ